MSKIQNKQIEVSENFDINSQNLININDIYINGIINIGSILTGYILPNTRGTINQILKTDGSGNVTWQNDIEGIAGSIADTQVAFGNSSSAITGNANFTWNNTSKTISIANPNGILKIVGDDPETYLDYTRVFRGWSLGHSLDQNVSLVAKTGNLGLYSSWELDYSTQKKQKLIFDIDGKGLYLYTGYQNSDNNAFSIYTQTLSTPAYQQVFKVEGNGEVLIGINTIRTGKVSIKGDGFAGATTTLDLQSSTSQSIFKIYDNGNITAILINASQTTFNNSIGYYAGNSISSGVGNTFNGHFAGYTVTTGSYNIGLGYYALGSNSLTANNNIGIGNSAGFSLTNGTGNALIGFAAGYSLSSGNYNSIFGYQAGSNITTGSNNYVAGYQAGGNLTTASNSIAIGEEALKGHNVLGLTGSQNIGIGNLAGFNLTTGVYNILQGYQSGYALTDGTSNVILGREAGKSLISSNDNVILGYFSMGLHVSGTRNVAIGRQPMGQSLAGSYNVALGYACLNGDASTTDISYNVGIGYQAGYNLTTGQNNVLIGKNSAQYISTASNSIAIGEDALKGHNVLGLTGNHNIGLGYRTGYNLTTGTDNFLVGYQAGYNLTTANKIIAIGYMAAYSNTTGGYNTAIGSESLYSNISGEYNTAIGNNTLRLNTGNQNTAIGSGSLYNNIGGFYNTAVGTGSLANSNGDWNVALGTNAGLSKTTGEYNTFVGSQAGVTSTTVNYNTYCGARAGFLNLIGSSNVCIGYEAGYNETSSNKLYISNSSTANPLIYGEFDNSILRINGTFQIGIPSGTGYAFPSTTGTLNQILKVDASGDLIWGSDSSTVNSIGDILDVDLTGLQEGDVLYYNGATDPMWVPISINELDKVTPNTGTVVNFVSRQIFNTDTSPATGNIIDNLMSAKLGVVQKIYHNDSSTPTVPAGWVLLGTGVYVINVLNIIYAEWTSGTRVEYWIVQEQ